MKLRRSVASIPLGALLLVSCSGASSSEPPVLRVAGGSLVSRSAEAGADLATIEGLNQLDASVLANLRFESAVGLPALDSDAKAYVIEPSGLPTDEVEKLLAIFGIEGQLVDETSTGTGFIAGSTDSTGPRLTVSGDALMSWGYSPPIQVDSLSPACEESVALEPVAPPTPVTDSVVVSDTEAPAADEEVLVDPCPEVGEPQGVPTEDEALQMFSELMSDIGVDIGLLDLEIFSDAYGVTISGFLLVDGVRSPLSWVAGYGEDAQLTFAGGVLASPQAFADYPRIGTAAAIDQLNEQQSDLVESVASAPGAVPLPEPTLVEIVEVEEELIVLYGVDGAVYLVPGYAFLADPGDLGYEPRYTIVGIPDEYVDMAAPLEAGDSSPGFEGGSSENPGEPDSGTEDPGMIEGPMDEISTEEANTLLGMSESEATSTAEANGWVVRIATRDGEQFALTMDYNYKRVNLTVDNGVVTDVFIG